MHQGPTSWMVSSFIRLHPEARASRISGCFRVDRAQSSSLTTPVAAVNAILAVGSPDLQGQVDLRGWIRQDTQREAMAHRVCPWWLGYWLICPLRRCEQNPAEILAPHVREGMTVFEPGSGMGFFTLDLARLVGAS